MLMDPQPGESILGQAIAANAIVTTLLDELVAVKALAPEQAAKIVQTALVLVSGFNDSPAHDSARVTLTKMLKDRT